MTRFVPPAAFVNAILADPPVNNADLLQLAVVLDEHAARIDAAIHAVSSVARDARHQAVRLRAFAIGRAARMAENSPDNIVNFPNTASHGTGDDTP